MANENERIVKCIQGRADTGNIFLGLNFPLTRGAVIVEIPIEFVVMAQAGTETNGGIITQQYNE